MSAVEDLHAVVADLGYTDGDIAALRLLAGAGWSAEKAAAIVLDAKLNGRDPVAMARKFISFSQIVKGR